ncbi:MAG: UDP-N-acetylglucosamine 2-epimerase [Pseudomonadota bacterium]
MTKTALIVVGTRPEAIKLAPVHQALRQHGEFRVELLSTGQHREMLASALDVFALAPDHNLDLMREGQQQAELVGAMLPAISAVLAKRQPDCVIVQGDTCSTFVGALAGFIHKTMVVHVEAGLRTGDKFSPYPEEMYRRMTADLADLHCAPTERARENLLREGVPAERIFVTGNTAVDALRMALQRPMEQTSLADNPGLLELLTTPFVLITCHRRESFGEDMEGMMRALSSLAARHPSLSFIFPVHLNPNVREVVQRHLAGHDNIQLLPPLDYAAFVHLLDRSLFVMTDSGGIQEECADLGKPVLVLRRVTERGEGVAAGPAILVGVDAQKIEEAAERLVTDPDFYRSHAVPAHVYGDGHAATRIAALIAQHLGETR